mgnify:FL=1
MPLPVPFLRPAAAAWRHAGFSLLAATAALAAVHCRTPSATTVPPTALTNHAPATGNAAWILAQIPATRDAPPARAETGALLPPSRGARIVRAAQTEDQGLVITELTREFAAAGGLDLSFDGLRMLFVGRKSETAADGAWEMSVDGGDPREVVHPAGGCDIALYLSTLFTLDSKGPVDRIAYRGIGSIAEPSALYSCRADGSDAFPITFAPSGVWNPALLPDGRLRFATTGGTFTVNVDGTDVFPFPKDDQRDPRQAADRTSDLASVDSALSDTTWRTVQAIPVGPRTRPPGRSTVVNRNSRSGQLYCLDASIGESGLRTHDNAHPIASVRLFTIDPGSASTGSSGHLLGEASVERDGSFFLEVPATTPLRLQTLDADGSTLREMKSWFWVMPMERRGCIGCHEDRRLTPPNRHVLALRKPPQRVAVSGSPMRTHEERDEANPP